MKDEQKMSRQGAGVWGSSIKDSKGCTNNGRLYLKTKLYSVNNEYFLYSIDRSNIKKSSGTLVKLLAIMCKLSC